MIAVRPVQFVNRGSVLASGFMIGTAAMGVTEARRRVLRLWRPGVQIKKLKAGGAGETLIVLLPSPVRVIAEEAIGGPLVRRNRLLIALPLVQEEINALAAPDDSLVFANSGRIVTVPLAELAVEDVAEWIDTGGFEVAEVSSLGAPPHVPVFEPPKFDARENIPGIPPAASELQNLLDRLRQQREGGGAVPATQPALSVAARVRQYLRGVWRNWKQRKRASTVPGGSRAGISLGFALRQGLARLGRYVRSLRSGLGRKTAQQGSVQTPQPKAASGENRVWKWLRRNGNRFLNFTRVAQLLSSRYGRYLARMMDMMESGDIEEGLRHAIPLADATELPKRMSLLSRLPQRRSSLEINPNRGAAGSTWGLGGDLYGYLRDLYRRAFERLKAAGRIEEAAFVLTELLSAHAEAVSFLEKHGRFRIAAEIAEARKMAPALAIRLWWLARERERAIALAIRTGEFEKAISLLSDHPEEAARLRIAWAERLARSGKFLAAADALWPLHSERYFAGQFLDEAIELGGTSGAMALAKRSAHFPETFTDMLPRVEALMADESAEFAGARRAFAETLRVQPGTPESRSLARIAARSLLRDAQRGFSPLVPAQLRNLLDYTADPCLRADVPALQVMLEGVNYGPESSPPVCIIEIAASDVGSHAVCDLAWLPDGRMLLAMGEAGLLFLSREGKIIARSNEPAEELVVSDDGSRAIGIARRDSVSRLIRIDVLARKATYWCDATITAHTPNFDGSVWCAANGEDVFVIDTLAKGFDALWRIPDMGGSILAMQRNRKDSLFYVVSVGKPLTLWKYEQPGWVLRSRQILDSDADQPGRPAESETGPVELRGPVAIGEEGDIYVEMVTIFPNPLPRVVNQIKISGVACERQALDGGVSGGRLSHAAAREQWMAVPVFQESGVDVYVLNTRSGKAELRLRLPGVEGIALRFAGNMLLCADNQGRALAMDIASGGCVRDFRV